MTHIYKANKSATKAIKIAIVGAGLMGYWHSRFALKAGATIVAIVDKNLSHAKTLALKTGNSKPYANLNAMLKEHKPDVIHICTPLSTHYILVQQVIENGIHILVEKPLAHTSAQVIKIYQLAKTKNLLICPIHQFCFQRGIIKTANALKGFGQPLRIDFNIASAGASNLPFDQFNGVLEEILPHPFSILRYLWPDQHFDCHNWVIKQHKKGELLILGSYNQIALTLYISLSARPTRCEFSIQTTTGTLHVNLFHDYLIKEYGTVSKMRKIMQPLILCSKTFYFCTANLFRRTITRQSAYPGLQQLISHFYHAVIHHTPLSISTDDSICVAIARDEIAEMMRR